MVYVVMGVLGFFMLHAFDVVCLKKIPVVKPIVWLVANGLLISSVIMIALSPDKLVLPVWSTWLGWVLLFMGVFSKAYSLLISLPFRKTYVASGVGDRLVMTGVYALVRYPWIYTFALILLALILVSKSRLLLIASPIYILLNLLLAVIQDKFLFDKMFAEYERYRKQTPMLLPNRKSMSACMKTIKPVHGVIAQGRSEQ
jgi:protein-S-isoprenylcysteine O-methyltransferase Ste14